MRWSLIFSLSIVAGLAGCGASLPDLQSRLSPAARDAEWPQLVPLAPIIAQTDILPRDPAAEGLTLEARAESLRRRAAALQGRVLD